MHRRIATLAAVATLSLTLAACSGGEAPSSTSPPSGPAASTAPEASASPTYTEDGGADATAPAAPSATAPAQVEPDGKSSFLKGTSMDLQRALFTLDALVVADPASMDGYSEGIYAPGPDAEEAGWSTQMLPSKECDVTEALLLRDGAGVDTQSDCTIIAGQWVDPFSRTTSTSPDEITATYVVPPAEAWRSGGHKWSDEQAMIYGSSSEALVAAVASQSSARGDKRPDQWKPEDTSTWCPYAIRWVGVKNEFGLTLASEDEREALREMLNTCPAEGIGTEA